MLGVVLRNLPNDALRGLEGVVMASNSCALAKGQFEKGSEEFLLASFADIGRDRVPHVGDDNNVRERRVTTKFV